MKTLKLMIVGLALMPIAGYAQGVGSVVVNVGRNVYVRAAPIIINGAANTARATPGQQEVQRQLRESALRAAQQFPQAAQQAARWGASDPMRSNGGNYANSTPQRICSNGLQQWYC